MWQGNPPVITQQPGYNPQFMQQGQPSYDPNQQFPPQQFPMNQYPQPGIGFQPQQQQQFGQPPPYTYAPQQFGPPPMMGGGMSAGGGGGMMQKVMGALNEVVDVNPINAMHSTGDFLTGYRAPPLMPLAPVEGCPLGLEFLLQTEHLLVKQQVEKMEALLSQVGVPVETPNRYDILNSTGNRIYFAAETGGLLGMQCAPSGKTRPFKMIVVDFSGRPILNIERNWSCQYCCLATCFNCCGTTGTQVTVSLGDGTYLGQVVQKFNFCTAKLIVEDDAGNEVAEVVGPGCSDCCCACPGSCGCDVKFKAQTPDGIEFGEITKKWSGFLVEGLTDADNFGVNFPVDLAVQAKAMLLAADFMFFEENPQDHRRNN